VCSLCVHCKIIFDLSIQLHFNLFDEKKKKKRKKKKKKKVLMFITIRYFGILQSKVSCLLRFLFQMFCLIICYKRKFCSSTS